MFQVYQAYKYFEQIKSGDIDFLTFINKGLKSLNEEDKVLYRDVVKSTVNRYYFLKWECERLELDDNDFYVVLLALYHYKKGFNDETLKAYINECKEYFSYDSDKIYSKITSLNHGFYPLTEKEEKNFITSTGLRFAYPFYIVKMMVNQHGYSQTYKLLSSSRKNIPLSLAVETKKTTVSKVLESYKEDFQIGTLSSRTISYVGKNIVKHPLFVKRDIYVLDQVSAHLGDKLQIEALDDILLIHPKRDSFSRDVLRQLNDLGNLTVVCQNPIQEKNLRESIGNKKAPLEIFTSDMDVLLTHVPYSRFNKVCLFVDSTELGLVRHNPQGLLRLKQSDIDGIIAKEYEDLTEGLKFVRTNGKLIYVAYTYNKKETYQIINKYLNEHKNVTLEEERMIFASDIPSDGVYYAILNKTSDD